MRTPGGQKCHGHMPGYGLAQGVQLKDGKDPATGERVTTWEVKR